MRADVLNPAEEAATGGEAPSGAARGGVPVGGASVAGSANTGVGAFIVGSELNNRSVVFLVRYAETSFLFTGDAEIRAEHDVIETFGARGLAADVLKIGHHGSAAGTTSAFLDAVRPRVALLSVGAHNSYGHPSPSVLERLRGVGCAVWSTAAQGTVELRTDGRRLWVRAGREPDP